jgi:hypothetical protein
MKEKDPNRADEDWLVERARRLVPSVRRMTDQELRVRASFVQMVINYADEADRIHAKRQQEEAP